jgi:hypothetical protein
MHHDEAMPAVSMCLKLSLADRHLLREYAHRHDITMTDVVRMGIRNVCGGVDKPERVNAA